LDEVELLNINCRNVYGRVVPLYFSFTDAAELFNIPFTAISGRTLIAGGILEGQNGQALQTT
jgi:hypothetical protein